MCCFHGFESVGGGDQNRGKLPRPSPNSIGSPYKKTDLKLYKYNKITAGCIYIVKFLLHITVWIGDITLDL